MNNGNYVGDSGGFERTLDAVATAVKMGLRVAMPGRVVSFDPDKQTVTVQPKIQQLLADGSGEDLPPLSDVPAYCMRGGKFVVTMPITEGDDCLVIFGDRAIDAWFESASEAPPADYRQHDLSDGFALVGFSPIPNAVPKYNPDAAELRNLDGDQYVRLAPDGSITNATAGGSTVLSAAGAFAINAPAGITLNGNTLVIGDLNGAAGNGGTGGGTWANVIRALDLATPSVASHDTHVHSNPEGGNVGPAKNA
jgi:hypothetical protein